MRSPPQRPDGIGVTMRTGGPLTAAARTRETTMPTYDYICRHCGQEFQRVERISEHEKAKPKCPKCKSSKVERVLTGVFVKTSKKT